MTFIENFAGSKPCYARLKQVIGRSAVSVNSFAYHAASDTLLQVAGSSIIVSSASAQSRHEGHLISSSKQTLTCVAVTSCGRFAATGEAGHQPCVRIWQLRDEHNQFSGRLLRELPAHTQAISIVRFTPDDRTLISIGCQFDAQIITWDWRNGRDLGVGKLMSPVNALSIAFDSSMCVTVGAKSVKYWYLPLASDGINRRSGLTSRSAILADKRNATFVDATFCDQHNRLLVVALNGDILEFNGNKKYVKSYSWHDSGQFHAVCISRSPDGLLVGCSDGLLRLFSLTGDDLDFVCDLATPTRLLLDPALVYEPSHLYQHPNDAIFPEPRCIAASIHSHTFLVGYSDRSLIEYSRVDGDWTFRRASLAHCGAINSIENFPSTSPCLPAGTVITGGSDGTIRFWNFEPNVNDGNNSDVLNILCPSLLKVIHLDDNIDVLTDKRQYDAQFDEPSGSDHLPSTGVTCTKIAHDGRLMVAGTTAGTIFFIDLSFSDMPTLDVVNAHDSHVTCLDFSDHLKTKYPSFMASGGRDRFVHVFRRVAYSSQFGHCAVLDAHQSTIKSIQFTSNNNELQLMTCASDKTIVVWQLDSVGEQTCNFVRLNQIAANSSLSDMKLIKHVDLLVVAGHDRKLREYDLNGKLVREIVGIDEMISQHGRISRVTIDQSGTYFCTICSDKHVFIGDVRTGNIVAGLAGFGAQPIDAVFSDDLKSLLVVNADGLIFIWRLADNLHQRMVSAQVRLLEEVALRTSTPDSLLGSGSDTISDDSTHLHRPLGIPEFSNSSTSLTSYHDDDYEDNRFEMSIGGSSFARIGDSSYSPSVQIAPAADRRTQTNLFVGNEHYDGDASETQSDFVSSARRRAHRFQSEEDSLRTHYDHLIPPNVRRSASPLQTDPPGVRQYQSSKSMMNLRDVNGRAPTAKELMISHLNAQKNNQGSQNAYDRKKWTEISAANDWQALSQNDIHHISPVMVSSPAARKSTGLQQIQQISSTTPAFRRQSADRHSLSRKFVETGGTQPKTVWSPPQLTPSTRRSNSNLFAEVNASSADPVRRLADDNLTASLRSRSQSPNKLATLGNIPSSASSTASGGSRDRTRNLQQKRRDSDMSYLKSSRNGDLRKSTDALNRLMAAKNKLHQSSENLRKSTDNLTLIANEDENKKRTRSISNMRDGQNLGSSTSSLAQSRMLARSMGNMMDEDVLVEGNHDSYNSPSKRLANTIQMMKKASNPDLTAAEQYSDADSSSPFALRMRGPVQKKVDRYRPIMSSRRNQTSEESDSNTSDLVSTTVNRRALMVGRSSGSSETSRPSLVGFQRRPGSITTPRRSGNYISNRMSDQKSIEGADLGSDDSPRSSINSNDWQGLIESARDGAKHPLINHVQDCIQQLNINVDKSMQARKLVENETSLSIEQKKIIMCEIDRTIERLVEKLNSQQSTVDKQKSSSPNNNNISTTTPSNDYTPLKTVNYGLLK